MLDALILCGGKGSRLASVVSDVPKPMALVNGRPFLDYVLEYVRGLAIVKRVILATGYMAEKIESHYGNSYKSLQIQYSFEDAPLGTGGAALLALARFELSSPFLMLNGDSFINGQVSGLLDRTITKQADLGILLARVDDASRYGCVTMIDERVTAFAEKSAEQEGGLVNSGIYIVQPKSLAQWADHTGSLSLEYDVIPKLINAGTVIGEICKGDFIDIGTPQSYLKASAFGFDF